MARNAIESEFRTSKMGAGSHFVKNFKKNKIPYWSKMQRNAIKREFRTSNMADGSHFVKISKKNKVAYRSEMARNAIENEFRTSKMADCSHFVKKFKTKIKFRIDLKWPEMPSKVSFGQPFFFKFTKIKIMVLIWNGKKWFLGIQNGYRWPFKKNHLQTKLSEWFEQCSNRLLAKYNLI